jgi:hypothetical protein
VERLDGLLVHPEKLERTNAFRTMGNSTGHAGAGAIQEIEISRSNY